MMPVKLQPVIELKPLGLIPRFPTTEQDGESVSDCSDSITNCPAAPRLGAVGFVNTGAQADTIVSVDVTVNVAVAVVVSVAVDVSVAVAVTVAVVLPVGVAVVVRVAVCVMVGVLVAPEGVSVTVEVTVLVAVIDPVTVFVEVMTGGTTTGGTGAGFHFPHPVTTPTIIKVKRNNLLSLFEQFFISFSFFFIYYRNRN